MEYIFRKATIQDFSEISTLYREAVSKMIVRGIFQWDEIYPNDEVLLEDIMQEEMFLLTTEDGGIVSCIVINEEQDDAYLTGNWKYTEGRIAVIHRLCVHPKDQGSGIGRRTMLSAEEYAGNMGYDIIRLDVFSLNIAAQKLYEGLGYSYAGSIKFRKGLFHLMERNYTGTE